jgi:cytochrome c2
MIYAVKMMIRNAAALVFSMLVLTGGAYAASAPSAERGQESFQDQCTMCHAAGKVKGGDQGPSLTGVVGRHAGSLPGFEYSSALKASGKIWTLKNLDTFLADPPGLVPGTKMPANVGDADDRADIIAFLATAK